MTVESLWPLALLLTIPAVILLYLLKPKGKDYRISSTLLWEKWLHNQQSHTFLEKFVHNILMYVQILILALLALSLMSPYWKTQGRGKENVILVFDTSGSMQHDAGNGKTRLEEAVDRAKTRIASSEDTAFSVIACDGRGSRLLAVGVKDRQSLHAALNQLACMDGPGNLREAEGVVETLRGAGGEDEAHVPEIVVYTDGVGAGEAEGLSSYFGAQIQAVGQPVSNAALNFLSYTQAEGAGGVQDGATVCAASLTNYSDVECSLEISLYEGNRLLEIRQVSLNAGETSLCFFEEFLWQGEPLCSRISSIRFAGKEEGDSLSQDNEAYALPAGESRVEAFLLGEGNTYLEKAYQAATGRSLIRLGGGQEWQEDAQAVGICDAGQSGRLPSDADGLLFGDEEGRTGSRKNVLLTVSECDLMAGLSSFSVGVNETAVYEVPEWGTGFLWAGEECAGYYGEHDGVKRVVVGFDIRESDFPLKAEFPVFLSNALHFLADTSLLAGNIYMAGDTVLFHPQADLDVGSLTAPTDKAGLYEVAAGDRTEPYVVRFDTAGQSDGQLTAPGSVSQTEEGERLVKRRVRNVLLVICLLLLAAEWYLYRRQTRGHKRFYAAVRTVGAALVLLALLGVSVNRRDSVTTTIFLVDLSKSNEQNLPAMEKYLNRVLAEMPAKNQYGIVTFGKDSVVDQFLTRENSFSGILSLPDKTATNFETAMSRALAMLPAGGAGRVVVLTDGKETKGELTATASAVLARDAQLLALTWESVQGQDAYVENVELPSYLYQGDAYTMTVTVASNYETDAQLQIYMGSVQTQSYDVHLNRGENRFQFRQTVTGENIESFEVRVAATGDSCEENNSFFAYAAVDSIPRALLVTGRKEDSRSFENLLRSANCNFQTVSAVNAPDSLEEMLEFKSILLENVYLPDLPEGFLENIETYVKDYGCGLVCLGGEDSYALGAYRDSALERVLPVDMELRGVDEVPTTAMIMVIDHSGSMSMDAGGGKTNLDLAITAAEAAVDQMRDTDYVGIITFDNTYSWVVEPVLASDKRAIKEQIETIAEGGGTTIQPALWEALSGAVKCEADIRHVILLTDGQGESRSYGELTAAYMDGSVTLSTVAVGSDSDTRLLERLADQCGGRYYYSDMAADIPKIFAQEVFLSGDTYLQNGVFALAVNGGSEITGGLFADGWPAVYGYVSATPKPSSQVLIASEKDDPILSVMRYGLGHTAAWNTDVTNQWTAGFAGQEDYAQLFRRIVDYSAGNAAIGEDSAEVSTAGGYTSVVYQAADYSEQTKVEAVYTDPEGNTRTEPLKPSAPGRFEGKLSTDLSGIYQLSVRRIEDGEIAGSVTTAAAVQYSDEYKFGISTKAFSDFVKRYGTFLEPEENFWQQREGQAKERYELTEWLIFLAILWFVMDIAFRRFRFLPQETKLYGSIRESVRRKMRGAARPAGADRAVGSGSAGRAGTGTERRPVGETAGRSEAGKDRQMRSETAQPPAAKGEGQPENRQAAAGTNGKREAGQPGPDMEGRQKKQKKTRRQDKKQEPQALDTSALLQKKDRRKGL